MRIGSSETGMQSPSAPEILESSLAQDVNQAIASQGAIERALVAGTMVGHEQANKDSLSPQEQKECLNALERTMKKSENIDGVTARWGAIEAALRSNPLIMRNLRRLQQAGAELVVTDFRDGILVEFADAALNLNITRQEQVLQRLIEDTAQRDAVIGRIVQSLPEERRGKVTRYILDMLQRSPHHGGFNEIEAVVYAAVHGGNLITPDVLRSFAKRTPNDYEVTDTWFSNVFCLNGGGGPYGYRCGGKILNSWKVNSSCRERSTGARVAGLRVPLSASPVPSP